MTQKEIDKFLASTKVYVAGKSKEIQEKLFSLGYKWNEGDTDVIFTECPFLYIDNNHHITYGCDMCDFMGYGHREITAEEILSLELTKPKFDPKTLKPFDKVLVRNNPKRKWCCNQFSHIDYEAVHRNVCMHGESWKRCIPYNDETKHLVGTSEEAPEYYRYWDECINKEKNER